MVPFKELGLGLSEEQISEEEARNLTDGFSLPALKVTHLERRTAECARPVSLCVPRCCVSGAFDVMTLIAERALRSDEETFVFWCQCS